MGGIEYAQFGLCHTAGKPINHVGQLSKHTFNLFPAIDVLQHDITQEIRVKGAHYNKILEFSTPDESYIARRIGWGRDRLDADELPRYKVSFYAVGLVPLPGSSPEALRDKLGFAPDAPLYREMKPPRLHSDVVYCDDDMRINFGVMGGVYVVRRLLTPGQSISFT